MKKFTIPCQFGAKKAPFDVYIGLPADDEHPLKFQNWWLWEERGGRIPPEVMESFKKLHAISKKNNVDFEDLCVYALNAANEEKSQKTKDHNEQVEKQSQFVQHRFRILVSKAALSAFYEEDFYLLSVVTTNARDVFGHSLLLLRAARFAAFKSQWASAPLRLEELSSFGLVEHYQTGTHLTANAYRHLIDKYFPERRVVVFSLLALINQFKTPFTSLLPFILQENVPDSSPSEASLDTTDDQSLVKRKNVLHTTTTNISSVAPEQSTEWLTKVTLLRQERVKHERQTEEQVYTFSLLWEPQQPALRLLQVQLNIDAEKYTAALSHLEELDSSAVDAGQRYAMLGYCYWKLDRKAEAEQNFQRAFPLMDAQAYAQWLYAQYCWEQQEYIPCMHALLKALSLEDESKYIPQINQLLAQIISQEMAI